MIFSPRNNNNQQLEKNKMAKPRLQIVIDIDPSQKPTHPIVIPPDTAVPPEIWGGADEGFPTPPIQIPHPPLVIWGPGDPRPQPPIELPPEAKPEPVPPGIWGGGGEGFPTPPIVIPPDQAPPKNFYVVYYDKEESEWKAISFVPGGKPPTTPGPKR